MTMPAEGEKAPAFTVADQEGNPWSLATLKGRPVVLYFYPKDDTSGCTKEACSFRDANKDLEELGAVVLGVSKDDAARHQKFREKYHLNFPLLVDDGKLSEAYGAWGEKTLYGRKFLGMHRITFLIGPDGRVAKVWKKVKPEGHADEVLEALRALP